MNQEPHRDREQKRESHREQKQKEEAIQLDGVILEEVRGAFRVKVDDMDLVVLCRLSGKMRKNRIRVVPGDNVQIEISPYDMERGRITYREKGNGGRPLPPQK